MCQPTNKQLSNLDKIIKHIGLKATKDYFYKFYPEGDFYNMSKSQCQKMWTGLSSKLPSPIINTHNSSYYTWGRFE